MSQWYVYGALAYLLGQRIGIENAVDFTSVVLAEAMWHEAQLAGEEVEFDLGMNEMMRNYWRTK